MRVVKLTWTEVSDHEAFVLVPDEVNLEDYDLENAVGQLEDDGFAGCTRTDMEWTEKHHFGSYDTHQVQSGKVEELNLEGYEYN